MVSCVPLRTRCAIGTRKEEKRMGTAVPIIRQDGEGERLWFAGGGVWTMKATSRETQGAFTLIDDRMVQGKTTPLHTHPNLEETLIVLEGEILVHADGTEHRLGPRGVAVAPRGLAHACTPLWSPRSPHAFSRCRRPEVARPSTGTQPSRRQPKPTRRGPTSIALGQQRRTTPTS